MYRRLVRYVWTCMCTSLPTRGAGGKRCVQGCLFPVPSCYWCILCNGKGQVLYFCLEGEGMRRETKF
jgi:hypothetical protein